MLEVFLKTKRFLQSPGSGILGSWGNGRKENLQSLPWTWFLAACCSQVHCNFLNLFQSTQPGSLLFEGLWCLQSGWWRQQVTPLHARGSITTVFTQLSLGPPLWAACWPWSSTLRRMFRSRPAGVVSLQCPQDRDQAFTPQSFLL